MAFFDSPKNRAMWDREVATLRPERAAREASGFMPAQKRAEVMDAPQQNPHRTKITLEQLGNIVQQERQQMAPEKAAQTMQRQAAMAKSAPVQSAPAKSAPAKVAPPKAAARL